MQAGVDMNNVSFRGIGEATAVMGDTKQTHTVGAMVLAYNFNDKASVHGAAAYIMDKTEPKDAPAIETKKIEGELGACWGPVTWAQACAEIGVRGVLGNSAASSNGQTGLGIMGKGGLKINL
jgi:hypothetical protein